MAKRFIVLVEGLSPADERRFLDFIDQNNLSWWHRFENVWFLVNRDKAISSKEINQFLRDLKSSVRGIAYEVQPASWAGFGQAEEIEELFAWLKREPWKRAKEAPKESGS